MGWKKVAGKVAPHAPLLGTVLGGPLGGGVGALVAAAFGVENTPAAVDAAIERDPQAAAKLRELQERNQTELEAAHIRAAETSVREVNETMRIEATSGDPYVRRARPTLIYLTGLIVAVMVVGSLLVIGLVAWASPSTLPDVVAGLVGIIQALMAPLSILCASVGVYVRSRSTCDKAYASGKEPPPGIIQQLLSKRDAP